MMHSPPPSGRIMMLLALASCLLWSIQAFVTPQQQVKTSGFFRPTNYLGKELPALTSTANSEDNEDDTNEENTPTPAPVPTSTKSSKLSSVASTKDSSGMFKSGSSFKLTKTAVTNRWDNFDYHQQWYPVTWDIDLITNQPTKVTLFDVDYVIARDAEGKYSALEDRCPHKAAALSEGRMTDSGLFQCAYHGWSFDGTNGDCVQIPQAPPSSPPKKACAKAVPIIEHQQMIWLWPGPDKPTSLPPTIPEMDQEEFKVIKVVRDFPDVDWPLLVSNILDPDHGCFAHQALAFDMYSANAQHPLHVQEHFEGPSWGFSSQVAAVDKVLEVDQDKRESLGLKTKKNKTQPQRRKAKAETDAKASFGLKPPQTGESEETIQATAQMWAPTTISLCRRDAQGETKFITAFWVCPVGTGKSRFMSAAVGSIFPFQIPRWIFQLNLNRFLDQDTLLVASQQPPILKAEAEGVEKPRSSLFTYGSATDKVVRLIDQFWDSTLHKVPNRHRTLLQLYHAGKLNQCASREVVLDRNVQHLRICPDSQGFVRNCGIINKTGLAIATAWAVKALWERALPKFRWVPVLSGLVAFVADQLRRQFYFCKTEASRDKDLKQIPVKAWLDP